MFLGQSESSCPESWYTHSQGSCKLNTGNLEEIFSDLLVYPLVHMRCFIWFMMTYHDFISIIHYLPWFAMIYLFPAGGTEGPIRSTWNAEVWGHKWGGRSRRKGLGPFAPLHLLLGQANLGNYLGSKHYLEMQLRLFISMIIVISPLGCNLFLQVWLKIVIMASTAPPSTALATLQPDILVSGSLRNHSSTQRKTHRSENAKKLHRCLGNIGELPILIDTTLGVWRFGTFWNQTITQYNTCKLWNKILSCRAPCMGIAGWSSTTGWWYGNTSQPRLLTPTWILLLGMENPSDVGMIAAKFCCCLTINILPRNCSLTICAKPTYPK